MIIKKLVKKVLPTPVIDWIRHRADRRCRFYDLSKLDMHTRIPRSHFIQFYSSVNNIGNYLPVLGIQKALGIETDVWCMHHHQEVDFDFINSNYKGAIIGGAGLLHECFQPFWKTMAERLKIPAVVWGIGGCFEDSKDNISVVERKIAQQVFHRCDLINLRDDITAEYYALHDVSITPCPTIIYVAPFRGQPESHSKVLFSSHEELTSQNETDLIRGIILRSVGEYLYTCNYQTPDRGLDDMIRQYYCKSKLVVTTRLHGAIIAYGLSIPYISIAYDDKLRAFHRLFGNGILVEAPQSIVDFLTDPAIHETVKEPPRVDLVMEYSTQVRMWMASL